MLSESHNISESLKRLIHLQGVSHGEARYEWFSDVDQSYDYAPIIDSYGNASDTPGIESKANKDDGEDDKGYTVSDEYWFRVLVECAG
ncbi:hypothetical protein XPA_003868 [Xanthoria parietina]